jgi:hypothetical protein
MARAPAAAAPVVAEEPVPAADVAADIALEEEAAGGGAAVVVATILRNADGSYTLETGAGPEAMDSAVMGATPDAEAPAATGQTFSPDESGIGELMTAVLDLVDPENAGGAQAKAAFDEGFNGPAPAPPVV